MPRMDGAAVLKEIRKHNHEIKVLVATATRMTFEELRGLGADRVIYKPIDLTILSEEIKALLPPVEDTGGAEIARIEIVEDEVDISDFLRDSLFVPMGFQVFMAQDASSGFELFCAKRPHIVIVDLAVPNKEHGYNLVQKLARLKEPPPPKSIIIATAALGDTTEELKRQGYPIFDKPIDLPRLKQRVLEACRRHGLKLKTGSDA